MLYKLCSLFFVASLAQAQVSFDACYENEAYKDLTTSVQALQTAIDQLPNCKDSPDLKNVLEAQAKLQGAVTQLKGFWVDPSGISNDPTSFASSLNLALSSVSSLGDSLGQSPLINSKCAVDVMTGGKLLLALGDTISSLAPFALFAATMSPALATSMPYVTGAVVLASVARVTFKVIQGNNLDMSQAEHRNLVLKNSCQYVQMSERLRLIELAESGQIAEMNQVLTERLDHLHKILEQKPLLKSAVYDYENKIQKLRETTAGLYQDLSNLQSLQNDFGSNPNPLRLCLYFESKLKQPSTEFPFYPVTRLELLKNLMPMESQKELTSLIDSHISLENNLKDLILKNGPIKQSDICRDQALAWFESLDRVLHASEKTATRLPSLFETPMNQNTDYKIWTLQVQRTEQERQALNQVARYAETISPESAAMSRSELHTRLEQIRQGLFVSNGFFHLFSGSPVLNWIQHNLNEFDRTLEQFKQDYSRIAIDSLLLASKNVPPKPDNALLRSQAFRLELIHEDQFSENSRAWTSLCRRLESLEVSWRAARNHVLSTVAFCNSIDPILDSPIDPGIIKTCRGRNDLVGRSLQISKTNEFLQQLETGEIQEHLKLARQKMKNLKCDWVQFPEEFDFNKKSLSNATGIF